MKPDAQQFFRDGLPRLARALQASCALVESTSRGLAGGRANWQKTFTGRLTGRLDPSEYRLRWPLKSFDTPENQLLKHYLEDVVSLTRWLEAQLGSRAIPFPVRRALAAAGQVLSDPYLQRVTPVAGVTAVMRRRAMRHRACQYGVAATLEAEYRRAVTQGRWAAILEMLQAGWLEPVSDEDLFELYALLLAIDILEDELGLSIDLPHGLSLVTAGREHVARMSGAGLSVRVYFDTSPRVALGLQSEYTQMLRAYDGLPDGKEPRPDVILVAQSAMKTVVLLIEVKDTEDDRYMRGSLYKVLGYARDFRALWEEQDCTPGIILLFPGPVTPKQPAGPVNEIELAGASDRERLTRLLANALGAIAT